MVGKHKDKDLEGPETPKQRRGGGDMEKFFQKKQPADLPPVSKMAAAGKKPALAPADSDNESVAGGSERGEDSDGGPLSRSFMKRLVAPIMKELSAIKTDVLHVGNRVERLETRQLEVIKHGAALESQAQIYRCQLNSALLAIEDQENRSRRRNVRFRGLPESYAHELGFHMISELEI